MTHRPNPVPARPVEVPERPSKTFSFHADPDLTRAIAEQAEREDRTVSSLIRVALRRYVQAASVEVAR